MKLSHSAVKRFYDKEALKITQDRLEKIKIPGVPLTTQDFEDEHKKTL